jgi:hypothetical protein
MVRIAHAKTSWYVSCSPREPKKLLPELKLLLKYDGKEWTEKEQVLFAESLKGLDSFEGEGYDNEPAFSARDRVAKLKKYGFAFVTKEQGKKILHITEAGKEILKSRIPEEIFLKQMLKWQYPSNQHRSKTQYPPDRFIIRPFIFTLKLIMALKGISKTELAIFAFTTTDENKLNSIVDEIKLYRKRREAISGKTKKLQFDERYFTKKLRGLKHLKLNSYYDMADALTRHLRFTPLFTTSGNKIILSENMKSLSEWIISQPISINTDYDDEKKFYSYFGNPNLPTTILDDSKMLVNSINIIYEQITTLKKHLSIKTIQSKKPLPTSILKLKELLFDLINEKKEHMKLNLQQVIQKDPARDEILNMFDSIEEREVIDAPTYFEWNMWRALLHIDDEQKIVPNFNMDADLQPTNSAGGKKGDIEAYYADFNLLVEVTLSSGQRQANTEIEPVWRHVGNFQTQSKGKKTIGLFVAPKIDTATPRDFFVKINHPLFDGATTTIIPLTLEQFKDVFRFISNIKTNKSKKLLRLWNLFELEATSNRHKHGVSWFDTFPEIISNWKTEILRIKN